jgi:hypothetical protein
MRIRCIIKVLKPWCCAAHNAESLMISLAALSHDTVMFGYTQTMREPRCQRIRLRRPELI